MAWLKNKELYIESFIYETWFKGNFFLKLCLNQLEKKQKPKLKKALYVIICLK